MTPDSSSSPREPGQASGQLTVSPRFLVEGVGGNLLAVFVTVLSGIVNVRICLDYLGTENYGLVLLVGTVSGWMGLSDLGLGMAARQRLAVLLAKDDLTQARQVLASSVACLAGASFVLFAILFLLHGLGLTERLVRESADSQRSASLILLGVSLFLVRIPLGPLGGLQIAQNRLFAHYMFEIGFSILRPVFSWVALSNGVSLEVFLVIMASLSLLATFARYGHARLRTPALRFTPRSASLRTVRDLAVPGLAFLALNTSYIVIYSTDNAVISATLGVAAIPAFAVAFRLFSICRRVCISGAQVLFSASAILHTKGQASQLRSYLEVSSRFFTTLSVVAGSGLLIFGERLIALWLGPELSPGSETITTLAVMLPVAVLINSLGRMVCGVGKHQRQSVISLAEMTLNVALSIALAPHLGVFGVALGTLISRGLVLPFFIHDAKRVFELDPASLRRILVPFLLLSGTCFPVSALVALPASGPLSDLIVGLLLYGAVGCSLVAVLAPREVRRKLASRWSRLRS